MAALSVTSCEAVWCSLVLLLCVRSTLQHPAVKDTLQQPPVIRTIQELALRDTVPHHAVRDTQQRPAIRETMLQSVVKDVIQNRVVRDKRSARRDTTTWGYQATTWSPTTIAAAAAGTGGGGGAGGAGGGGGQVVSGPSGAGQYNNQDMQLAYLSQFGYISDSSKQEISNVISHGGSQPSTMTAAIRQFQHMMSIPETGVMDAKTKATMASPRCGNKDQQYPGSRRRRKRYDTYGALWLTTVITWKIVIYSRQMDYTTQTHILVKAFTSWSDVTPLRFVQDQSAVTANIEIKFVKGDHGDGYPFDGASGVLAHAFFLNPGSYFTRIHFDEEEFWTENSASLGINLLWVARHEIGHAIGLAHSDNKWATMRATYFPFDFLGNKLGTDDVSGIQSRYGKRRADHFCSVGKMAAMLTIRDETYLILNSFMLTATSNQINPTILAVSEVFKKNVNNIVDAIFHYNNRIYVFQGNAVYVYSQYFFYVTEKSLSEVINFGLNYVSAAFVYNNKAYLVGVNRIYEVEPQADHSMLLLGTTDLTSDWGIPRSCEISAVTTWIYGNVYFFCEDYYYIYPQRAGDTSYPRSTSQYWWGCSGTGNLGASSSSTGSPLTGQNRILEVAEARAVASASGAAPVPRAHPAVVAILILQTLYLVYRAKHR